jgi:hypothetical protein
MDRYRDKVVGVFNNALTCGTGTGVLVDVLFNEAGSASL